MLRSLAIEVVYPRYLSERVVRLALRTLRRIYNVKDTFFVGPYSPVLLAAVTKPCLAKKVFALMKTHANMNLLTLHHWYFLREYNICHLIFNLRHSNVLLLFRPCFRTYLYFVKAFEVLRLHISPEHLKHTKACKFDILLGYKANCVECLLVHDVA